MPRPLDVIVVNAMSVSTGPRHARRILRNAAEHADVIFGSECSDFIGAQVLGYDWHVWQDTSFIGRTDDEMKARAGCLIAIRRDRGRLSDCAIELGVARRPGDTMRNRFIPTATLRADGCPPFKGLAAHPPPKRLWVLWFPYMLKVRRANADVAAGDWNKLARAVHRMLGRRVRSKRLLGVVVRHRIPVSRATAIDVGGDHLAVKVTLWPEKRKRRRRRR